MHINFKKIDLLGINILPLTIGFNYPLLIIIIVNPWKESVNNYQETSITFDPNLIR